MDYTTTEIEEKANRLLNDMLSEMFAQNNKIIGEHPSKQNHEVGIDHFYEIRDRETGEFLNLMLNQNKGTASIDIIKTESHPECGKISFQLKLRHAKYFTRELNNPLFFTLCDISTNKIYWYWIQLDNSIDSRIEAQESQKSLQIYIPVSNELKVGHFKKFYADLDKSHRHQTHKYYKSKLSTEDEYDFKELENSEMHIIDKILASIKKFDGLSIIPKHILQRVYPFKGTRDKTYIISETLRTDNRKLYDLFEALEKTNDIIKVKPEYNKTIIIDGYEDKLKEVLDFLKENLIHHMMWTGKGHKERLCVHDLFTYGNSCECERCSFNKLDFKTATFKLTDNKPNESSIDKFKRAYTYYLLGDLKGAYLLYLEINKETKENENSILNTLCKYNLINLKNLINGSYYEKDRKIMLAELGKINFVLDEIIIEHNYYRDVFDWIKENRFFNSSILEIDKFLGEIQNHHRKDKNGGYFRNKLPYDLKFKFLRISYFIEFNLIIYDVFDEYQVLIHKSLEALFGLYNIYNPDSTRYDKFESPFINIWLMHAKPAKMNQILLKYDIREIELNDEKEVFKKLSENLENLCSSINQIKGNEKKYFFNDKVKNIIQNFAYILSRIKMNKSDFNILLNKYSDLITLLNDDYLISLIKFETIFHYRKDISIENTKKIMKLLTDNDLFETQSYNKCFDYYLSIQDFDKGNLSVDIILAIFNSNIDKTSMELDFYLNFTKYENLLRIDVLKEKVKDFIEIKALKRLEEKFDSEYYYNLSIYDIITFKKDLFDKYVLSIKDLTLKPSGHELISGMKQRKNHDLGNLINLSYKYNISFTNEIKQLSKYAHESKYYDWLMDLEGFDYSSFNQYWLLEYRTRLYFEEFKKHKKLKEEVKKALQENYIEGVAKIYINHFD